MFEIIRANQRKSMVLVFVMLLLLLGLGFVFGSALVPSIGATYLEGGAPAPGPGGQQDVAMQLVFDPTAGFVGMGVAAVLWLLLSLAAYWQGDRILLSSTGAVEIQKEDHPRLFNIVEEMKIAAQLPKMPRVAIIDTRVPNAFAAGRSPDNAVVAVTVGLLEKLDRDELQGVVAHEVGHIVNRDVLFMTMLGVMVGTIVILADVFLRSVFYSSLAGTRRSSRKEGGGVQIILFVIAIVLAILAPILAQVIYFAASRRREYLADASAAIYTRYPDGLARALEKISRGAGDYKKSKASRVTAPMYIVNPMQARGRSTGLFSTHPDTQERIRILRAMAGGSVGYAEYQAAWKSVDGERAGSLPGSALASGEAQPAREAHPDAKKPPERPFAQVPGMEGQSETAQRVVGGMLAGAGLEVARRQQSQIPMAQKRREERARRHEAADAMRRRQGFRFAECQCGLRFKVAPDYVREQINCPRCGRPNAVQRPNRAQRRKRARR